MGQQDSHANRFGTTHRAAVATRGSGHLRFAGMLASGLAILAMLGWAPAVEADVGYSGSSYLGTSKPTGDKPQSKLWFNDGIWWGSMYNSATGRSEIHQLDRSTHTWHSTGIVLDGRRNAGIDTLWSGGHLYVASAGLSPTSQTDSARVSRYSYDPLLKRYSLDLGFPVTVSSGGMENVVLDRDTAGKLWVTFTQGQEVKVAHTTTDDHAWSDPWALPFAEAKSITADDISAIVAYSGKVGIMWSNQNDGGMYFASHRDGDPSDAWSLSTALKEPEYADDHINLKALETDPSGQVFAATKTSLNKADAPLLLLLVLDGSGGWKRHTYGTVAENHTRAQLAIDRENRQLYMFATSPCCNGGAIYYKQTSLDRISFPRGLGVPFMQSETDTHISNVTTTKQPLTSATGLVALAGDDETHRYFHNELVLDAGDTTPPDTTIDSGPEETADSPVATFEFSATEPATFECSLDGAAFSKCTSPHGFTDLSDGTHTFRVRAIDDAGNVDATPGERTWTVKDTTTAKTIATSADSYVREASPSSAGGTATTIKTDGGTGARMASYFRFPVSGVSHKVLSARLRVYVTNGTGNGPAIYPTNGAWSEGGLTWSNRPAATGPATDDKGALASGTWVEYDVTPLVRGNGTYNFVTTQPSTDGTEVNSKEHSSRRPTLELIVDPAPNTNITSGPTGTQRSTSAEFGFESSESDSTFACSLDGGAYRTCTSPQRYDDLSDGDHTFLVRSIDANGSADPSPAKRSWTVDTMRPQAPTVELATRSDTGRSKVDRVTADRTPTIEGATEPGALVSIYDGEERLGTSTANADGRWAFDPEPLGDGNHSITATATDPAGNLSDASAATTVVVDTDAPPAPTIERPDDGASSGTSTLLVAGTAVDDADITVFEDDLPRASTPSREGGAWETQLQGVSDGEHSLKATAADLAGNTSPASGVRQVTVDTDPPETAISARPNNPTSRPSATFEFSSDEAAATFECRLDGGAWESCSSPASYESLAEGEHAFEVRAVDAVGHVDETPASHRWTIDLDIPTAPVLVAPEDGSKSKSTTVKVAGTAQPGVGIEIFDGARQIGTTTTDAAGDWSFDATELSDGLHVFTAKATKSGHTSAASKSRSVTVDTVAPATSIDGGPSGVVGVSDASFRFSSDEGETQFECRLDGDEFTSCSSPRDLTSLADGDHTFAVRAVDAAGNVDSTPAIREWTVDTVAPDTGIDGGPSGIVTSSDARFEFSAPETGAAFECRTDAGAWAKCSSPHDLSGLGHGAHEFEVRATDAAGNVDPTPAARKWRVEEVIFSDDFETGGFSHWSAVEAGGDGRAEAQNTIVRSGVFAAQLSATANTGSYAFARQSVRGETDVTASVDVRILAEGVSGGNVPILRFFDPFDARMLNLRRQNKSSDRIYIEHGATNVLTSGRLPLDRWARFNVTVATAGQDAGTIEVRLDGALIYRTTSAETSTAGIGTVQIGNETRKQPFSLVADDVVIRAR